MIYTLDWSLPMMLLCCKMSEFAWSAYDGKKWKSDLRKQREYSSSSQQITTNDGSDSKTITTTSFSSQLEKPRKAITEMPDLLEYYSFSFNFVGFLTGPFLEFEDYRDFVKKSLKQEGKDSIPLDWGVVLFRLFFGLGNVILMRVGDSWNANYALQPEFFENHNLFLRWMYLWIAVELSYCKYYFAWSVGEGACAAIGMSFNGYDEKTGKAKWDKTRMMDLITFKLSDNWKDMIDNWNIPCQIWLKYCNHLIVVGGFFFFANF
jgi:hypothetical protein